jgi:peptide/nickel transport system permease protein
VLVLVSAITFFLVNLAPGGPSALMRMDATPEQREALTRRFGLDQPVPVRYLAWLGAAMHGDLGTSLLTQEAVTKRLAERLPNTLTLALLALGLSIVLGIPMGVASALRRGGALDHALGLLSSLGLSVPAFWLGIMLILVFSVELQLLPSSGVAANGAGFDPGDRAAHLLMPTVVLATTILPTIVRYTRSALLRAHGPRQGAGPARRDLRPRAAQRAGARGQRRRHPAAAPDRRRGGDRGGVRLAGHGAAGGGGGAGPRLPAGGGDHGGGGRGGAREQPGGRPGVHVDRPADPARLSGPRPDQRAPRAAGAPAGSPAPAGAAPPGRRDPRAGVLWRRLARRPVALVALLVLVLVHLAVFTGPRLWTLSPQATDPANALLGPSAEHPLGTDELGRDELSRLLQGGQVSLLVGFAAMLTSIGLGVLVGAIAGFYGGWTGAVLMRATDAMLAIPAFFLILAAVTVLGAGPATLVLVIGATSWMAVARVIFGETLRWKAAEFVLAAESIGAGGGYVLARHVLPQTVGSVIVAATLGVGLAILTESAISYLGLGIQPPTASWGNMLQHAQQYVFTEATLAFYPGVLVTLVVLAYNFLGDGLRDALDPRL